MSLSSSPEFMSALKVQFLNKVLQIDSCQNCCHRGQDLSKCKAAVQTSSAELSIFVHEREIDAS